MWWEPGSLPMGCTHWAVARPQGSASCRRSLWVTVNRAQPGSSKVNGAPGVRVG